MGLWSWLFPSADDRVARAQKLLDAGEYAEARLEVAELDHPGAEAILIEAETALAKMNLEHAVSWGNTGDYDRVDHHMQLANQFHRGGLEEEFRATRRALREQREARRAETEAKAKADEAVLSEINRSALGAMDPALEAFAADDELQARLALLMENYPEALRSEFATLGAPFARAVLDLEDGRADLALQALVTMDDNSALVLWERARTAYALGDPGAAARALRQFAQNAGGHFPIGRQHSGVFMAQCLAESGEPQQALAALRSLRADQPKLGGVLYAQLLEATGELAEAEHVLKQLIQDHPRENMLYKLLARVRVRGGHRSSAMQALEASLSVQVCTPGKCGYQPPDPEVLRSLAILYFEDKVQLERAGELADQAAAATQQPTWEDAYLQTLRANREQRPDAAALLTRLREVTPANDPRTMRLAEYLPA